MKFSLNVKLGYVFLNKIRDILLVIIWSCYSDGIDDVRKDMFFFYCF